LCYNHYSHCYTVMSGDLTHIEPWFVDVCSSASL